METAQPVLGGDHRQTLASTSNLALCLSDQGNDAEAESFWRATLAGQIRVLGEDHPDTLVTRSNLAMSLFKKSQYAEAESLWTVAWTSQKRILGEDHPDTLRMLSNLATAMRLQGRRDEAEVYFRRCLDGFRRTLGDHHPQTLASQQNLAKNFQEQGKLEEAEALFAKTLETAAKVGSVDPVTLAAIHGNYGICLLKMERYAEAETEDLASYEGLAAVAGPQHAKTLEAAGRLVDLYEAWNKPDKAAEYRALLPRKEE